MATFTEHHVSVAVQLVTNPDGSKHAFLTASSYDAAGNHIRDLGETEVTGALNPTQQAEALDLLAAAEAYVKSLWGIA